MKEVVYSIVFASVGAPLLEGYMLNEAYADATIVPRQRVVAVREKDALVSGRDRFYGDVSD